MYRAVTRSIEVVVTPRFVADRSSPENNYFFWAYTIAITNHGAETVQRRCPRCLTGQDNALDPCFTIATTRSGDRRAISARVTGGTGVNRRASRHARDAAGHGLESPPPAWPFRD